SLLDAARGIAPGRPRIGRADLLPDAVTGAARFAWVFRAWASGARHAWGERENDRQHSRRRGRRSGGYVIVGSVAALNGWSAWDPLSERFERSDDRSVEGADRALRLFLLWGWAEICPGGTKSSASARPSTTPVDPRSGPRATTIDNDRATAPRRGLAPAGTP